MLCGEPWLVVSDKQRRSEHEDRPTLGILTYYQRITSLLAFNHIGSTLSKCHHAVFGGTCTLLRWWHLWNHGGGFPYRVWVPFVQDWWWWVGLMFPGERDLPAAGCWDCAAKAPKLMAINDSHHCLVIRMKHWFLGFWQYSNKWWDFPLG